MNKECETCKGKCCKGIIDVYPTDELELYNSDYIIWNSKFRFFCMKTDKSNQCIALTKEGKCSIYEKRPESCRLFEINSKCCEAFKISLKNEHVCKDCPITLRLKANFDEVRGKWQKEFVNKLVQEIGIEHLKSMQVLGLVCEERQKAYMQGYDKGYSDHVVLTKEENMH